MTENNVIHSGGSGASGCEIGRLYCLVDKYKDFVAQFKHIWNAVVNTYRYLRFQNYSPFPLNTAGEARY